MMHSRYDAKDTAIIVDGTYITGLGEDMFEVEKEEDFFEDSVGAQGDIVESVINDSRGTFKLYIQVTSPSKPFLLSLANREEPFPIWAVNKKLGERSGGTMAKLLTLPAMKRGATAEDMELTFRVFDLVVDASI